MHVLLQMYSPPRAVAGRDTDVVRCTSSPVSGLVPADDEFFHGELECTGAYRVLVLHDVPDRCRPQLHLLQQPACFLGAAWLAGPESTLIAGHSFRVADGAPVFSPPRVCVHHQSLSQSGNETAIGGRVLDPEAGLLATLDLRLGEFLEGHRESWWLSWLGPLEGGGDEGSALLLMAQQLWTEFGAGREGDLAAQGAGALGHFFGSAAGLLSLIVLTPIYAWYLLFELERIHSVVRRYVPAPEKERVARIAQSIGTVLTAFFRGRLTVCALKGVLLSLGLLVVGAPYAVFLGMTSGFASLAPFVGSLAGYAFSFLVALLEPGADLGLTFLFVSAVFGLAEVVEGYVLMPRILGDSLGLHPLFVFVAIFIGGATLGMFGFLLALPLAASGLILFRELVLPALEQFAAGSEAGVGEEQPAEPGGGETPSGS